VPQRALRFGEGLVRVVNVCFGLEADIATRLLSAKSGHCSQEPFSCGAPRAPCYRPKSSMASITIPVPTAIIRMSDATRT